MPKNDALCKEIGKRKCKVQMLSNIPCVREEQCLCSIAATLFGRESTHKLKPYSNAVA